MPLSYSPLKVGEVGQHPTALSLTEWSVKPR
jgi:hypothetical protein